MELYEALGLGALGAPGNAGGPAVIALVGGGGKTSSLFALGTSAAARGRSALLCTTTHIRDPRAEKQRKFDRVIADPRFAAAPDGLRGAGLAGACIKGQPGEVFVLGGGIIPPKDGETPLLASIDARWPAALAPFFDIVAVEADGSRGLPIKAPKSTEPVMPAGADIVIGCIGLECLGRPMNAVTVHRPELFGPLVGCGPSDIITVGHIIALARSPLGIFKDCPQRAARVLLLNKAELCAGSGKTAAGTGAAQAAARALADADVADLVLLASLRPDGLSVSPPLCEIIAAFGAANWKKYEL